MTRTGSSTVPAVAGGRNHPTPWRAALYVSGIVCGSRFCPSAIEVDAETLEAELVVRGVLRDVGLVLMEGAR